MKEVFYCKLYTDRDPDFIVKAKQSDAKSRYLSIQLLHDQGMPYNLKNHTVKFNALKESGKHIWNECTITDESNGVIEVELTDQTLAEGDSLIRADVSVFSLDGNVVLTTRTFGVHVQRMIRDDAAIESSDEYGVIVNLIKDVYELKNEIDNWFSTIKDKVNLLQIFDFDNRAALDKATYAISESGGVVKETINNTKTGAKIAERTTDVNREPYIETINVYTEEDGKLSKRSTIQTSFDENGQAIEEIEGYDDYELPKAYQSEIRVDGGTF